MKTVSTKMIWKLSALPSSLIFTILLCVACSKDEPPESAPAAAPKTDTPITPQATGLVKNPVKLSDTADAVKWMDMASTKSPAQIAKEEKAAKDANDAKVAKLAAEAKQAADAKLAADARLAAEAKLAADAKLAAEAKAAATKAKEAQSVAAAQPIVAPKAAIVVAQEPVLKILSKEQPKFPVVAVQDGVTAGTVTAQLHIEPDGRVSKVDIVKANPLKYFDHAVIAAALRWKYAPISKPMTTTMEFNFIFKDE